MAKKQVLNETEKFELEQKKKAAKNIKNKPTETVDYIESTVSTPTVDNTIEEIEDDKQLPEERVVFLNGEVEKVVDVLGKLNLSSVTSETRLKIIKLKLNLNKELETIKKYQTEVADSIKPADFESKMHKGTAENATEEEKAEWQIYIKNLDNKFRQEITPYFLEAIVIDFKPIENQDDYDKILADTTKVTEVQELEYIYYKLFKQ